MKSSKSTLLIIVILALVISIGAFALLNRKSAYTKDENNVTKSANSPTPAEKAEKPANLKPAPAPDPNAKIPVNSTDGKPPTNASAPQVSSP